MLPTVAVPNFVAELALPLNDPINVGAVTLPVKVGLAKLAFKFKAVCTAVEIGLFASLVLSTLPKPTCAFVTECGLSTLLM